MGDKKTIELNIPRTAEERIEASKYDVSWLQPETIRALCEKAMRERDEADERIEKLTAERDEAIARAEKAEFDRNTYIKAWGKQHNKDCVDIDALTAELARKDAALRGWNEWWELPWEAKRPDIAQLRYNAARAALGESKQEIP